MRAGGGVGVWALHSLGLPRAPVFSYLELLRTSDVRVSPALGVSSTTYPINSQQDGV